jgi:hypothetical protein
MSLNVQVSNSEWGEDEVDPVPETNMHSLSEAIYFAGTGERFFTYPGAGVVCKSWEEAGINFDETSGGCSNAAGSE